MKRMFSTVFCTLILDLSVVPAFAETESSAIATQTDGVDWTLLVRFAGLFLLVMAILYILLLVTKKIAAWIDEHKK